MNVSVLGRLSEMRRARSLRWDVLGIYTLQFATVALGLLGGIIVARVLGPTGKGMVDLFQLLYTLLMELGLVGFNSGLLYHLANRGRPLGEVHGTALVFSGVAGGITALIAWLAWLVWPAWRPLLSGLPQWALLLALVLVPLAVYRSIWQTLMIGINRAVLSYQLGLVTGLMALGAIIALWQGGRLTPGAAIGVTASMLAVSAVVGLVILGKGGGKLRPSGQLARQSLQFGFVIYLSLLANLLHFKLDQVMINRLLGTGAVGVYAVSVRWAETLFLLDGALIAAALHRISSGTSSDSYRLTLRLMWRQLQISGGSGLVLVAVAYPLVTVLYGKAYSGAVLPLVLLVPGVVCWSLAKVLSQHLVYQRGMRWLPALYAVTGMITNIVLNLVLIPRWGITGAGLASMVSYGLMLALTAVTFRSVHESAATVVAGKEVG